MAQRTALVTGANRGLGFETSRQLGRLGYRVLLGARDLAKGEQAAAVLGGEGMDVVAVELDVTDPQEVSALANLGAIDVLVNNAGIVPDRALDKRGVFDVPPEVVLSGFENNTVSAYRVAQVVVPGMRERG